MLTHPSSQAETQAPPGRQGLPKGDRPHVRGVGRGRLEQAQAVKHAYLVPLKRCLRRRFALGPRLSFLDVQ